MTQKSLFPLVLTMSLLQYCMSESVQQLSSVPENAVLETVLARDSSNDSLAEQPLLIALIVLACFNLFILMIVWCCLCKGRSGFKVDLSQQRQHLNDRYPRNSTFKSKSRYCKDSEMIESAKCFNRYDTITELPAFIYGDELAEEVNVWRLISIKQCEHCRGMTKSIQIVKFGKVRECWDVLFMLLISPCFLAFTIRQLTCNGVLWVKSFCLQCGEEKPSESPLSS